MSTEGVSSWTKIKSLHEKNLAERGTKINWSKCNTCGGIFCAPFTLAFLFTISGAIALHVFSYDAFSGGYMTKLSPPNYDFYGKLGDPQCDDGDENHKWLCFATWIKEDDILKARLEGLTTVGMDIPPTPAEWENITMAESLKPVFNVLKRMNFDFTKDDDNELSTNYPYVRADKTVDKFANELLRGRPDTTSYTYGPNLYMPSYTYATIWVLVTDIVDDTDWWLQQDLTTFESRLEAIQYKLPTVLAPHPYDTRAYNRDVMSVWMSFLLAWILGYVISADAIKATKFIIHERQNGTKQLMEFLGLTQFQYWASQFYTHMYMQVLPVFVAFLLTIPHLSSADSNNDLELGAGQYIYFLFLMYITVINVTLYCFACSSLVRKESIYDAWSLVSSMMFCFIPVIVMIGTVNSDTAGHRFILQFIPLFNFAFGIRDSYKGITADTMFFHFFNTIFWSVMTWYLDLTIPTLKGARAKQCCFCFRKGAEQKVDSGVELGLVKDSFQQDDGDKPLLVIKDLKKMFGEFIAVNGLSLELRKNAIYGLLGFNGAGKTTTINMITGQIKPTSGSILINGIDVAQEIETLRQVMGVCTQTNILWDKLTVMDHIRLFGRLRGFTDDQIEKEASELMTALEMDHRVDNLASNLSGGEKRKLMVAAAFLGDPDFILLDEPTAGVDIDSRDAIQKLILDRKQGKLIMLTTHHMSEADYLCDDIGIMADGQIAITGNPTQLKVEHGQGTTFMMKSQTFAGEIDNLIKTNDVTVDEEDGYHKILCKDLEEVPGVLRVLQKHCEPGDIKIENNSLESVFLNLAKIRSRQSTRRSKLNLFSPSSNEEDEDDVIRKIAMEKYERPNLLVTAWLLSKKRFMVITKDIAPIARGLMIVIFMAILYIFFMNAIGWRDSPENFANIKDVTLDNDKYPVYGMESATFESPQVDITGTLYGTRGFYKGPTVPTMKKWDDFPKYSSWEVKTVSDITKPSVEDQAAIGDSTQRAVVGFANNEVTTTYVNENEQHYVRCVDASMLTCTSPYADCGTTNAKSTYADAVAECESRNLRLPTVDEAHVETLAYNIDNGERNVIQRRMCSSSGTDESCGTGAFWTSTRSADDAGKKVDMTKAYALMSPYYVGTSFASSRYQYKGVNPERQPLEAFSLGNYFETFFASFFFMLGSALMVCALYKYTSFEINNGMFEQQLLMGADYKLMYFVAFLWDFTICLAAVILFICITNPDSDTFKDTLSSWTAASISFILMMYTGGAYLSYDRLNTATMAMIGVLVIFVTYGMTLIDENLWMKILNVRNDDYDPYDDEHSGPITPTSVVFFRLLFYFTPPLQYILSQMLASITTNAGSGFQIYTSVHVAHWLWCFLGGTTFWIICFVLSQMKFRGDPYEESIQVSQEELTMEHNEDNVTCDTVSKVFLDGKGKKLIAANRVCFKVEKGRCTGVLGKNGAGKSTTMNMLSTLFGPTAGRGMIHNRHSVVNVNEIRSWTGICNQKNIYWKDFTVREHLNYFGQLRGVPAEEIEQQIHDFAIELKFIEHMDTKMDQLSGGNKRKVALCTSVMGASDVLYLDEPSAGVDPFARDEMKNVLVKLKSGRTVLFTSHTMEEAEIMCDDVVIMVKGVVEAAGEVNDLITQESKGYFLQIDTSGQKEADIAEIEKIVKNFGEVTEKPAQKAELIFSVDFTIPLSKVFETTAALKKRFGCECIVESANLAQLFKHVVREEEEENETAQTVFAVETASGSANEESSV